MPGYSEYVATVKTVIDPFVKEGVTLDENTEMVAELGLTSLQVMTLIEHIEDEFDISIPLNALPDLRTIGDLARLLVGIHP